MPDGERRNRSYSAASSYSECGERFRLERIVKVPVPPAVYFAAGGAFHSVCDGIDRVHWETNYWLSGPGIHLVWQETFAKEQKERNPDGLEWKGSGRRTKALPNGEDIAWWDENGPKMAIAYRDWRKAHPEFEIWEVPGGEPAIEVKIEATTLTGVPLIQYIDRVFVDNQTGALLVVDLKTSKREPSVPIQLADYRFGFEHVYDTPVWYGAYYMAREGMLTPPKDLSVWTPELVSKRYAEMDRAEQAGIYLPNIGMHCDNCSVRNYCAYVGGSKSA